MPINPQSPGKNETTKIFKTYLNFKLSQFAVINCVHPICQIRFTRPVCLLFFVLLTLIRTEQNSSHTLHFRFSCSHRVFQFLAVKSFRLFICVPLPLSHFLRRLLRQYFFTIFCQNPLFCLTFFDRAYALPVPNSRFTTPDTFLHGLLRTVHCQSQCEQKPQLAVVASLPHHQPQLPRSASV